MAAAAGSNKRQNKALRQGLAFLRDDRTATVGDFDFAQESMTETSTGRTLPVYNAIDSSASAAQKTAINTALAEAPGQLNFLSDSYGRYPLNSLGAVADRASRVTRSRCRASRITPVVSRAATRL